MLDGQEEMEVHSQTNGENKELNEKVVASVSPAQSQVRNEDVAKNERKRGGEGLLGRYGCSTVSLFKGGGLEAKFEDGAMIHLAPCSSSFLLQLPPHRDTPYGCGLHKIEYKSKFPTSLCRDKVRQLIQLKNKLNSQRWIYLAHANITSTATIDATSSFSPLPFDPSADDYAPVNCLYGKKLPRNIEEYNWHYTDIKKLEDGSLSLWDTNKTVHIHLKPHRQTFLVTFLAPKRKTENEAIGAKGDVSLTSSTPRVENSSSENGDHDKLEFVAATPRHKSVVNRNSLDGLKCNLGAKLNQMDETLQHNQSHDQSGMSSPGGSHLRGNSTGECVGGVENGISARKANWHQYVWVTQLQSVVVCHHTWRPAINLMLDYCRHSFITGLANTEEESSMASSSVAGFDQWVLEESCCSAYLHPWRVKKGYMESRETTDLWAEHSHPLETFVTDNFTFRILELEENEGRWTDGSNERRGGGCLFVEVDLPDGSLLRSEFDQFSPYKKPELFMRYQFNRIMQNVKSLTISLSSPPPKLPGHVYDLGQVAQQSADLLSSVISSTCKQRSSSASLSCVKKSFERAQDDLSLMNLSINSRKPTQNSNSSPENVNESTYPCGTPRSRFMGPYVTEQTQVECVGEFWAYSTGRVRVAFVDGVFLDMKLLTANMDTTLASNATGIGTGTPRNVYDNDGMMTTPRRSISSSTSAADLPPGLARMLMKDGTYQFVNVFNPPAQYTRYVLAASEWCNWVTCPESERPEAFTSENYIDVLVQSELKKIRNFNYLKENAPNFHNLNKRPEPVGGASPNESSSHGSHNSTLIANESKTDTKNVPQYSQQTKVPNVVPPIPIKDLIDSVTPKPSKMVSLSNKENVAVISEIASVRKAYDEKPRSQPNAKIPERSFHTETNKQIVKSQEVDDDNQSDAPAPQVDETLKFHSSESLHKSLEVTSLPPKTADDEMSSKLAPLKQCQNLISNNKANVVDLESTFDTNEPSRIVPKEMKKIEDDAPAEEKLRTVQNFQSSAKNETSNVAVTHYKQSDLQNEIQRIIQKTRQDLELLEIPLGANKKHANNTQNEVRRIVSPIESNGQSVAVTEIKPKSKEGQYISSGQFDDTRRTKTAKSVHNLAVPPPVEFSEGAQQMMETSSANQINVCAAASRDESNISLISRPKSPPVELFIKSVSEDSRGGSPPRSPPPRWKQGPELVAAASSALVGGVSPKGATSTESSINKNEPNCGEVTSGSGEPIGVDKVCLMANNDEQDKVLCAGENGEESTVFFPPPKTTHKSNPVDSKYSSYNLANSGTEPKAANLVITDDITPTYARNDLEYVSPKQLKEIQNQPLQQPKTKPEVQQFECNIDVDKFISENSAGLDVQFDFASVTEALFKTQQAIKTIENMLEKSSGTGNGSCSHQMPEVSSLDITQNNESSNETVQSP